jgi:hypothetical protein
MRAGGWAEPLEEPSVGQPQASFVRRVIRCERSRSRSRIMFSEPAPMKIAVPVAYVLHWRVAAPGSMVAGAWPDQFLYLRFYYGTILEAIIPCSAVIAGILGYFINRRTRRRVATFVFVPALLLVILGAYQLATGWSNPRAVTPQFLLHNVMGIHPCEGDCFGGIFFEALSVSAAYSLGAFLGLRVAKSQSISLPDVAAQS